MFPSLSELVRTRRERHGVLLVLLVLLRVVLDLNVLTISARCDRLP